ncbi:efflux RND transporter periplasmic adaptor subunit [Synechococcus sp. PCC 7336]|uniref:efflux RND transporter periplasmic adaptor subunit n=1 Tax=Synechococcus sp. PCC 7336 TaxID=195250 RepID=UPI00034A13B1|nr:efflux RND transporter periplasmic adaptor subunit [Synechococcus sp. PCC 7336]
MSARENQPALLDRASVDPSSLPQMVSGRPRWTGYLLAVILLGGGILVGRSLPVSQNQSSLAAATEQGPPARAVETIALTRGNGVRQVRLIGQVEPRSSAVIRPRTEGTVQEILVQPGDRVQAGTLLAVLDNLDQQLALSQARARLAEAESELARLEAGTRQETIAQRQAALQSARARELEALDNYARTQALVAEGALSRRLLIETQTQADAAMGARLEAEAALAEATAGPRLEEIAAQRAIVAANQIAVEQAQLVLERTEIRAATAGVVQSRSASNGDYLEAGDPILTIVDSNTLDIFLEVSEELSHQVEVGMQVSLSSRALPNWQLQVPIDAIIPTADSTSRRQEVRIQLDTPSADLVPGMAVRGEIALPVQTEGFVVPRDALTRQGTRWVVFTVNDDGTARELEVSPLADMGEQMAIAHPELQTGQTLVVQGGDGLQNGAPVKVIPRQVDAVSLAQ